MCKFQKTLQQKLNSKCWKILGALSTNGNTTNWQWRVPTSTFTDFDVHSCYRLQLSHCQISNWMRAHFDHVWATFCISADCPSECPTLQVKHGVLTQYQQLLVRWGGQSRVSNPNTEVKSKRTKAVSEIIIVILWGIRRGGASPNLLIDKWYLFVDLNGIKVATMKASR